MSLKQQATRRPGDVLLLKSSKVAGGGASVRMLRTAASPLKQNYCEGKAHQIKTKKLQITCHQDSRDIYKNWIQSSIQGNPVLTFHAAGSWRGLNFTQWAYHQRGLSGFRCHRNGPKPWTCTTPCS